MKLQLNETQFRNMLTEMVRNVLLEATTPEDIKKQCIDIMYNFFLKTKGQFTANYFRTHTFEHEDNPEELNFYDYMYKQFFETFFHSRTDQKVFELAPVICRLAFNYGFQDIPCQQQKINKLQQLVNCIQFKNEDIRNKSRKPIRDAQAKLEIAIKNGNENDIAIAEKELKIAQEDVNRKQLKYTHMTNFQNLVKTIDKLIDAETKVYDKEQIHQIYTYLKQNFGIEINEERLKEKEFVNNFTNINDNKPTNSENKNLHTYKVVELKTFDIAKKYGDKTGIFNLNTGSSKICYTQQPSTWDDWTQNGLYKAYVMLRDDWNTFQAPQINIKTNKETHTNDGYFGEEYTGYDNYGMSMIFFIVNKRGELMSSNTRWNHLGFYLPGRNCDHAFKASELCELIGSNKYFVDPIGDDCQKSLDNGYKIEDVFDDWEKIENNLYIVEYFDKYTIIKNNKILWFPNDKKYWFDYVSPFRYVDGIPNKVAQAKWKKKKYFITMSGQVYDKKFNSITPEEFKQIVDNSNDESNTYINETVRRVIKNYIR